MTGPYFSITISKPVQVSGGSGEIEEITEEFTISAEYLLAVKQILVAFELQSEGIMSG